MQEKIALRKNKNMVARVIDDETILLPIYKTSEEINCIYSLNQAASKIWQMLDGRKTLTDIKNHVLKEFDTTEKEVDEEMADFLKDLREIKAVV